MRSEATSVCYENPQPCVSCAADRQPAYSRPLVALRRQS